MTMVPPKPRNLELLRKSLDRTYVSDPEPSEYSVIFYSFDLVNSTHYKSINPNWISLFNKFFEFIQSEVRRETNNGLEVWKYVGDEVIIKQRVRTIEDILKSPKLAKRIMDSTINQLSDYNRPLKLNLSVKATVWIAKINDKYSEDDEHSDRNHNIRIQTPSQSNNSSENDYLGPDIDIGFRISKYSVSSIVSLSANLAWLIHRIESSTKIESAKSCKIVHYEQLKGVWGDRYYPVVWYAQKWDELGSMFSYDECMTNSIVKELYAKSHKREKLEGLDHLEKIFKDLKLEDEMLEWLEDIRSLHPVSDNVEKKAKTIPIGREAELHCSVLCFNSSKKVMVLKRASKPRFPKKWEFGCIQLTKDKDINTAVIMGYRKEYGLEIIGNDVIYPFLTYSFKSEDDRTIPGVRLIAKTATRPSTIKKKMDKSKHTDVRFISLKELKSFDEKDCVPGFKDAIERAFDLYDAFYREDL